MRSPFGWALLGLLIERPSYGYELLQRFQRVYGDMLALSGVSRIYEALEELQGHSLIEEFEPGTPEATLSRQPKPHYRATEKGIAGYQDWLVAQIGEERRRQWLFARQLGMLEPEAALEVIDHSETENLEAATKTTESQGEQPAPEGTSGLAKRLADEEERLALGVRLSWTEYARRELRALIKERDKER